MIFIKEKIFELKERLTNSLTIEEIRQWLVTTFMITLGYDLYSNDIISEHNDEIEE